MTGAGCTNSDQSDRSILLTAQLTTLQDVTSRFSAMRVDSTEYACLKALVLFKSGKFVMIGSQIKCINLDDSNINDQI